jgi:hypothetical protein
MAHPDRFFTTGKSNFSDFLSTFLKGIAQMLTNWLWLME